MYLLYVIRTFCFKGTNEVIRLYLFVILEKRSRRTLFVISKWTVLMAVTNLPVVSIHQYCTMCSVTL